MANIQITIPDQYLTRVIKAICVNHKYEDFLIDPNDPNKTIPNPETKAQFAKRMMCKWAKENLKEYEAKIAADAARDIVIIDIENNINIT